MVLAESGEPCNLTLLAEHYQDRLYYYPSTDISQADYYVIVDEADYVAFTFVTGLNYETSKRIIESIKCTEIVW